MEHKVPQDNKLTLVFGASPKSERYSYKAVLALAAHNYPVIAIGTRKGMIGDIEIHVDLPEILDVNTISLYLNADNQRKYYDDIFNLRPKRVIFNPGAENKQFYDKLTAVGIKAIEACTLIMLATKQF